MLKEKNVYKETLPVNVTTANIDEYPIHFHNDIEVVYVLDGTVTLKNGYYTYTLKQGDIFIINDREIHSFYNTGERNMVMMLQMDISYFSNYYDNLKNSFFVTDMDEDNEDSLEVLRTILARIMMEILQKGYGYEQKVIESTHNLISCLLSDFQYFVMEDGRFVNETKNKGNKILAGRLNRITDYMYENYTRKLTLNEIAQREHLSIYYLSHVIKEATGLSFQELLSFIRVEESEKLLLGTGKKIGTIAEETGFSAVRYYIKHFETWFGMHPLEYRKKYTGKVSSREIMAKYTMCTPAEIEAAIRRQVKGVYSDYLSKKKLKPIIVDVNLAEALADRKLKLTFPESLFESENMKPLARPFNLLRNLKEQVLASGLNYIVSSSVKNPGSIDSMSVLVYNINEELENALRAVTGKDKILDLLRKYENEIEVLVRCSGISGEFRISRYTMTRDNIITAYEDALRQHGATAKRQAIINNWSSLPKIEFSEITVSDTISQRTTLQGISSELLLIDRK